LRITHPFKILSKIFSKCRTMQFKIYNIKNPL
jgi:hypothetical protein